MRTFFFNKTPVGQKGFTLVELMVSIGIFSVITSVAVYNNAQFNSSILLTNLAYEIALSIRQAQVYGITVRKDSADNFNSAYGIHFNLSTPTSYILFQDTAADDHVYNTIGDVSLETFNVQKGNGVTKFCVTDSGAPTCYTGSGEALDITFVRPNPDALIYVGGVRHGKVEICVVSPQNLKRKILVEDTGQISVSADATVCN